MTIAMEPGLSMVCELHYRYYEDEETIPMHSHDAVVYSAEDAITLFLVTVVMMCAQSSQLDVTLPLHSLLCCPS